MVQSRGSSEREARLRGCSRHFMYVGYAGTAFVTGGQSLHSIIPALSEPPAIVAIGSSAWRPRSTVTT